MSDTDHTRKWLYLVFGLINITIAIILLILGATLDMDVSSRNTLFAVAGLLLTLGAVWGVKSRRIKITDGTIQKPEGEA